MNLDFLDSLWKPIGKGLSEVDRFVDREMPFDSGWGLPAAAVAAYFGGPALMSALGQGSASSVGAAEGTGALASGSGAAGTNSIMGSLSNLFGGSGSSGGFGIGQGANYTNFANTSGGSFGNLSALPSTSGGNFGLNFASPSAISASNSSLGLSNLSPNGSSMLKDQALNQLMKLGQQQSAQGQEQQQQPMQTPGLRLRQGQPVDVTSALLSLLAENQQINNPRISLI